MKGNGLRILFMLVFISSGIQAQISGTVKDSELKPVPGATVTLLNSGGRILYHAFSNKEGGFAFSLPDTARYQNIRRMEVRAFGWITQSRVFHPDTLHYPYIMEVAVHQLEELKITAKVSQKGDTTSYQVDAFQGREDRSIGDVISRLPHMSVSDDGIIRYKDKEIKGLYIQGDDLMQGRYGLATTAITPEKIRSIQVIERFQPIKVLKSRVISNDVAVNLVLKDENALQLSGNAIVGAGLPGLLNAGVTPMLFNKKVKTLNVAKYNNTGEKYSTASFEDLLNDAAVSNPGLPENTSTATGQHWPV